VPLSVNYSHPWCLKLVSGLSFCLRPLRSCWVPEQCTCWTPSHRPWASNLNSQLRVKPCRDTPTVSFSQTFTPEMTGVSFPDSTSAPVPKFLNSDQGPVIFLIWESDSCSDSGYNHRSNRNSPMISQKKWPHRFLLLLKLKSDSGPWSSEISDLLLFLSYFTSENKEIKYGDCFFGVCCVN